MSSRLVASTTTPARAAQNGSTPVRTSCHQLSGGVEHALLAAEVGEHQDGGKEGDGGPEALHLLPRRSQRQRTDGHHQQGCRDGAHTLRQPARTDHCESEYGDEAGNGDRLGHRCGHAVTLGAGAAARL
jgi:hypothetical protein